jgi:chromosomal replication initiation ATPase DnaA
MTVVFLSDEDIECLRVMEAEYQRLTIQHPLIKRALLARNAGARAFGIDIDDLISASRKRPSVTERRMLLMAAIKLSLLPNISMATIGQAFGARDHSTVTYAVNRYRLAVTQAMCCQLAA